MKTLFIPLLSVLVLMLMYGCNSSSVAVSYSKDATTWPEKPVGVLGFKAESPLYKADANFRKWVFGKLQIPNNDITQLKATVYVDINSVYEQTIRLTKDLKTEKYLDGVNFPMATAKISDVELIAGDKYKAKVELTIKKYTEVLDTEFVLSKEGGKMHVKGEINLLRKAFDVGNDEMKSIKDDVVVYYDTNLE